jgi:HSP20 family protein
VVTLNVPIDRDRATATMKDGVLEIVLPKAQAVRPRTVHIDVR